MRGTKGNDDLHDVSEVYMTDINIFKNKKNYLKPSFRRESETGNLNNCSVFFQEILEVMIKE